MVILIPVLTPSHQTSIPMSTMEIVHDLDHTCVRQQLATIVKIKDTQGHRQLVDKLKVDRIITNFEWKQSFFKVK